MQLAWSRMSAGMPNCRYSNATVACSSCLHPHADSSSTEAPNKLHLLLSPFPASRLGAAALNLGPATATAVAAASPLAAPAALSSCCGCLSQTHPAALQDLHTWCPWQAPAGNSCRKMLHHQQQQQQQRRSSTRHHQQRKQQIFSAQACRQQNQRQQQQQWQVQAGARHAHRATAGALQAWLGGGCLCGGLMTRHTTSAP